MAARINSKISDEHRQKIQTSQLINRLNNHIETHPDDPDFKKKFMDKSQVSAALGLLKKTVPDLQSIELSGDEENPIEMRGKITVELIKSNANPGSV